jgi:Fe2+ transport system protein B
MDWNEVFQIISGVIVSVGGAGGIILLLSSYFGKIWADRNLESMRKEYQKEIDAYKNQLDILKENKLLYFKQQFDLYNSFWQSLYNLKKAADNLWEDTNQENLINFSKQLRETIENVERNYLFIEDKHYKELKEILDKFSEYRLGKKKLIQIYNSVRDIRDTDIFNQGLILIDKNRSLKRKYEELINRIRNDLKKQIRGK